MVFRGERAEKVEGRRKHKGKIWVNDEGTELKAERHRGEAGWSVS